MARQQPGTLGLLMNIGEVFDGKYSPINGSMRVGCVVCTNQQFVYCGYAVRAERKVVHDSRCTYPGTCFPLVGGVWTHHPCLLCYFCLSPKGADKKEYSPAKLNALHVAAKETLRALPQPIFEEIWNHVGWEEYIKADSEPYTKP
jgi:hypothetical protein